MLDEEMDNMIREAAEQHHPSYNNTAWYKMEQLLDKHLPQKKDRRGLMFFLLLFLLIGGGLFFAGYYFSGNKKAITANAEPKKAEQRSPGVTTTPDNNSAPGNNSTTVQNTVPGVNGNDNTNSAVAPGNSNNNSFAVVKNAPKTSVNITPGNAVTDERSNAKSALNTNKLQPENRSPNNEITKVINANGDKKNITTGVKENAIENKQDVQTIAKKPVGADIVKEVVKEKGVKPVANNTTASTEKKKTKHSIAGNFGLSFSAGPDISYVDLNKPGKITLSYGVGLSYTFIKKLTLQTGFYVSRKLYASDSAHYHPSTAFWTYYPNMDNNIEANCKVYEIPVNLLYNFGQKRNHNWFAGAGLSSYFMKHETYDYSYKYAGQTYPKSYSLDNANQHNFSVLTLTGGYQYKISPHVSVSAEPYMKLPLNGIGFGKVHLKGGGVLFNVTVKPFGRRNKK